MKTISYMRKMQLNLDLTVISDMIKNSNIKNIENTHIISDKGINAVEIYKRGYKIRIKKKNQGKFTDYCNGKVTDACIQKGKHSSDPKIRKRATFADNARKWKHKLGGVI